MTGNASCDDKVADSIAQPRCEGGAFLAFHIWV